VGAEISMKSSILPAEGAAPRKKLTLKTVAAAAPSASKPAVSVAASKKAKVADSNPENPPSPVVTVKAVKVTASPKLAASAAAAAKAQAEAVALAPALVVVKPPPVQRAARGSRLAQLTVPSMAQAVASTAAKSSYSSAASLPPTVAPPHTAPKKDPRLANNWKTKPVAELTDPEVLSMSDDDYMNDVQMAFFRLKLVFLKQEILNSAGATTEHLREDTVVVPDPADRATIEEEHALELRTRDRERKLLKKIEQSINRIDSGDYGFCDETGESIGVGRLLARPTASLSLEAQQRRELKQKMFGD